MDELETKLISIYLIVCEAWEQGVCVSATRFSNHSNFDWTDQEIMTMYIFGLLCGLDSKKGIYEYIRNHWDAWFPNMKSYEAFSYVLLGKPGA